MYTFAFLGLSFLYISHATPLFGTPNSQLLHCIVFCLSLFLLRIYISCRIVESLRIKLFNAYQEYKSSNVFLGWVERTNHLTTSGRKGFEKAKKFLFFSSFLELALSTSMIVTKLLQKQLQKQSLSLEKRLSLKETELKAYRNQINFQWIRLAVFTLIYPICCAYFIESALGLL